MARLDLHDLPVSHRTGPTYLNALRILDLPQAAALAAERSRIRIDSPELAPWTFVTDTAKAPGCDGNQVEIRLAFP